MQQLLLDIHPLPSPSLANFIPGRNQELLQFLRDLLSKRTQERFVYVWGDSGCGKTHLLRAVVADYIQQDAKAVYCCAENPQQAVLDSRFDCIAIDDVDRLSAAQQIDLFHCYNRLRDENHAPLLISGKTAPMHLALRQDLVTRLGWGLVYQMHELTETEKIQAMQAHAVTCGYVLSQEICLYLLRHAQRDMPSLMAVLDALNRYALMHRRQITIPLLRELLQVTS